MSLEKHLNFLEVLYKKKLNIMCDLFIDEIDVHSHFFHKFMDVYVFQNKVLRLNKGLFRETYPFKEFNFEPHIAYQSYDLTAELHLTRKETLFILEKLKLIKKSYNDTSKTLFVPYPAPKFVENPQQSSSFLHFFKDFQSSKSCLIRFGIRVPEICFENSSTLSYPPNFTSKSKSSTTQKSAIPH